MIPAETPQRDWSLYYNNTWMLDDEGPVHVQVDRHGDGHFVGQRDFDDNFQRIEMENLRLFWPRFGAYNYNGEAYYMGRRARRSMKKSMSVDHYYMQWGETPRPMAQLMWMICKGPNHLSYEAAKESLDKQVMTSCAITHDIILQRVDVGKYNLLYKGVEAGIVEDNMFHPHYEAAPMTKRARLKLEREGIPCI